MLDAAIEAEERMNETAAEAAHEVNRVYCAAHGDFSQVPWKDAPQWQRDSAISGVRLACLGMTPAEQHEAWCEHKRREGWVQGPDKDPVRKTHPCLVPYDELSAEQQAKDGLYQTVVRGMIAALRQSRWGR